MCVWLRQGVSNSDPPPSPPAPTAPPRPIEDAPVDAPPTQSGDLLEGRSLAQLIEAEGSLSELKKRIEFEAIAHALQTSRGNITHAANQLGMKRPRLSQIIHANPELSALKKQAVKRR